jgi:hypothetical protein
VFIRQRKTPFCFFLSLYPLLQDREAPAIAFLSQNRDFKPGVGPRVSVFPPVIRLLFKWNAPLKVKPCFGSDREQDAEAFTISVILPGR